MSPTQFFNGLNQNTMNSVYDFINPMLCLSIPWGASKELFDIDGMSRFTIESDGKASFHQDYFDVGAFVYERIPVIKNLIFYINGKLSQRAGAHD